MNFSSIAWYSTIILQQYFTFLVLVDGRRRPELGRCENYSWKSLSIQSAAVPSSNRNRNTTFSSYRKTRTIPSNESKLDCSETLAVEKADGHESLSFAVLVSNVSNEQSQIESKFVRNTNNNIFIKGGSDEKKIGSSSFDAFDEKTVADESIIRLKYRNNGQEGTSTPSTSMKYPSLRTPMVYRYYPRRQNQPPTISSGSIPIILLGTNVDHWKIIGYQLSQRGYNVIAVGLKQEVLSPSSSTDSDEERAISLSQLSNSNEDRYLEGPGLIAQLLDALRWKKVVLVGCDIEASLAIQAALLLPSDRIAGLLLCGDLIESEEIFVANYKTSSCTRSPFELDRFLHERITCPFTIVWDGGTRDKSTGPSNGVPITSSASSLPGTMIHRSVIIGGGMAPHRRRPGIFTWILVRFMEEQVTPMITINQSKSSYTNFSKVRNSRSLFAKESGASSSSVFPLWLLSLPIWKYPSRIPVLWNVDDMFNEESMVVFGRIVATAIFYAVSLKVLVYHSAAPLKITLVIKNRVVDIFSVVLFVLRMPVMVIPFITNKIQTCNSGQIMQEGNVKNETITSSANGIDDEPKTNDNPDSDNGLRPFFFLDHVVA